MVEEIAQFIGENEYRVLFSCLEVSGMFNDTKEAVWIFAFPENHQDKVTAKLHNYIQPSNA